MSHYLTEPQIEALCYWAGPDAKHEELIDYVNSLLEDAVTQVTS